ncbi:LLM class flavin-dependent oxidoreductase [Stutzerimonas kirkiae]|uniref:LLM class flavin-dependent oxidoreductase n=1 Tax=Stutzerimonas kirkiae TaxID=2211392 RepID=A0A4Q9RCJ7_9GAMM|nr:LLM class flavin-dependent oxidoreductase [Stutzerimonas kirkiae]TBU98615.1 LLM class flavin-dependent oxidoreductase [Stutzerimonas kirkiae]TBV04212.1 LLM class flavin-dependent oxidoreductase [Stutzerimonas kirkiae]TBV10916.1 LLM class flavin-dependent oxidoreductase [Stutzerimonas kirkiae]
MSQPRRRLLLSAFLMNTPAHILEGLWRKPGAEQVRYNELALWTDLARQLEAAKFDALFFADVVGLYGNFNGGWDAFVSKGLQIPSNDPSVIISALAAATENIGLAYTSSVIQDPPFDFARKISTLDHASNGRIGWNIVTSEIANAHRNFNQPGFTPHEERYAWADEYVEVVYKLWEGSWDEGALLVDRERGVFADPAKVHKIWHKGPRYSVEGPHLVTPSPQRTPFLFQAGTSKTGRAFAARNAEAVFTFSGSPEDARHLVDDVRAQAVAHGRNARDLAFFAGLSFVVGSTEEEARRKKAEYDEYLDLEGLAAHAGGALDIDLGGVPLDTPLKDIRTEGGQGILDSLIRATPGNAPTVADMVRWRAENMRLVGTPEQIVDQLERWQDAGIDGINIVNHVIPGSYSEFIEGVLPELRRRGLAQSEYAPGSFREKVFGAREGFASGAQGAGYLSDRHPAARYRGAFVDVPK